MAVNVTGDPAAGEAVDGVTLNAETSGTLLL
jgi:hypothetical protein